MGGSGAACQSLGDVFPNPKLAQRSACLQPKYALLSEESTKKKFIAWGDLHFMYEFVPEVNKEVCARASARASCEGLVHT